MKSEAHRSDGPRAGRGVVISGTGLLLAIVVGTVLIGHVEPMTRNVALGIAGVGVTGLALMAWLMSRVTAYPRWAWFLTAGLMGAALVASVLLSRDPAAWENDVRPTSWMLPWFLLVMGTSPPKRAGICAPSDPRSGWLMVGSGLFIGVMLLFTHAIVDWILTIWRAA